MAAQILIDCFAAEGIIQVGLAGALDGDLEIGDIVLGDRYVEHDCDLTRMGLAAGEVLFDVAVEGQGFGVEPGMRMGGCDASPRLLALAESAAREVLAGAGPAWGAARGPRVVRGTIVTGDQFIQSAAKGAWLRETFGAIAIEMESAAAAHVCQINGVPFLGIRAISDRADGSAHMDMAASLPVAAQHYHRIVMKILEAWSASAGQV
jgi:adenosylhomocysteine nucleosidase